MMAMMTNEIGPVESDGLKPILKSIYQLGSQNWRREKNWVEMMTRLHSFEQLILKPDSLTQLA